MLAHRAALVVVHHDALADPRHLLADLGADRRDDAARLVPADHRVRVDRQAADRLAPGFRPAVLVEVAAAHARGLHLDDHLAGARGRVREFHQLDLAIALEDHAAHRFLQFSRSVYRRSSLRSFSRGRDRGSPAQGDPSRPARSLRGGSPDADQQAPSRIPPGRHGVPDGRRRPAIRRGSSKRSWRAPSTKSGGPAAEPACCALRRACSRPSPSSTNIGKRSI